MTQRLRVNGVTYPVASLDKVSLKTIMLFNRGAEEYGFDFNDLQAISDKDSADLKSSEEVMLFAALLWLTKREAGETLSFDDALETDVTSIEWLPETEDRPTPKAKKGPKGSAPAAAPAQSAAI